MTLVSLAGGGEKARERFLAPLKREVEATVPGTQVEWEAPPEEVDWLVLGDVSDSLDFGAYSKARAVQSLWAGVEAVLRRDPPQPLIRLVDPEGLTAGMTEWVVGHVMRHHLGLDRWTVPPHPGWAPEAPPLARDRRVGMIGLGELGTAAARALAGLGFDVAGWSRTAKDVPGVASHVGADGLRDVIRRSEILVLLVPHTAETEGLMNAERLNRMPEGSVLLNPGRGALVDEDALLAALERGRPGHATLDTFRVEPLPEGHPFWSHPQVTVTPHIASATRPETAAKVVAANIARLERGEAPVGLVDRGRGY